MTRTYARLAVIVVLLMIALMNGSGAAVVHGSHGIAWRVVCVDPGHPSEVNSGRTVQNGLTELNVNWQVAKELASILKTRGIRVVQTKRSRDEFVSNRKRAEIANKCSAVLMIRLHCDTGGKSGFAVYYPDRQASKSGRTGPSKAIMAKSRRAAECIRCGMASVLQGALKDDGLHGESATAVGRRQGALTGSIFSDVPVVTVEMAFLSSKRDAAFIGSSSGRKKVAEGLAAGIAEWLRQSPE
jgi:N-acetylmuramoyl-L-alanine amidase